MSSECHVGVQKNKTKRVVNSTQNVFSSKDGVDILRLIEQHSYASADNEAVSGLPSTQIRGHPAEAAWQIHVVHCTSRGKVH